MAEQVIRSNLKICSYNSHGLGVGRIEYIKRLVDNCHILLLQEHWLFADQFESFSIKFPGSLLHAVSGMNNDELIDGRRGYGGCAILVDLKWSAKVHPMSMQSNRVCAVRIEFNGTMMLVFNVYMPCDVAVGTYDVEYEAILSEIASMCELHPSDCVIIGGDFNTSFQRGQSCHTIALKRFMEQNFFFCGLHSSLSTVDFTYESKIDGTRSVIDHVLFSEGLYHRLLAYGVMDSGDNMSDHVALFTEVEVDAIFLETNESESEGCRPGCLRWDSASENDIALYRAKLDYVLLSTEVPTDAIECQNHACTMHNESILSFFEAISDACVQASTHLKQRKRRRVLAAGWSEQVQALKDSALLWHRIWKENDSPAAGLLFDIRKTTRRKYHEALKRVKADADRLQATRMAEGLASNTRRDLWTEVKKVRGGQKSRKVQVMDDRRDICTVFGEKYNSLYNSVPYDAEEMDILKYSVDGLVENRCGNLSCYANHKVSPLAIDRAIKKLKPGKSDGSQRLYTNHLKLASRTLHSYLATAFTALLMHGVIPPDFEASTLIPIPKCANKSLSNSENYRAIAMSSVIGKVLDHVLLEAHARALSTSELQFGFKPKHSTVTCNFALNEVVQHYVSHGSNIFCLSLDASKAFDRIQYVQLFRLLIRRGLCPLVLRFLVRLYTRQKVQVRWDNAISLEYNISNGVKQGGVMSPVLFAVYLDELLLELKEVGLGCHMGGCYSGALAYADDVCLLAPSRICLKEMLQVVGKFAARYDVLFNASKSALVIFGHQDSDRVTPLEFMGQRIPSFTQTKHLGLMIGHGAVSENLNRAVTDLFKRTNCLRAQFGHVPWRVRLQLFRSFCLHLYGCETWDLSSPALRSFLIAYRKCVRHLLGLPYRTHRALIAPITSFPQIDDQIMNRISKFVYTISNSSNQLVKFCAMSAISGSGSNISNNISVISSHFNIPRISFSIEIKKCSPPELDNETDTTSYAIKEILDAIDDDNILLGFDSNELKQFLISLCIG